MPLAFASPHAEHTRPLEDSGGYCQRCGMVHSLPAEEAAAACYELMDRLSKAGRIDFAAKEGLSDPQCATTTLFTKGGGKMFGVLVCRDSQGASRTLRAFSGQFNGLWTVPGWVGPVVDPDRLAGLTRQTEAEIKRIGREIAALPREAGVRAELFLRRRRLSRQLMQDIHALYRLKNFRGGQYPLTDVFQGSGAPPTGTGDCCGPKLLQHAAGSGLVPVSLAEFFWGRSTGSGTRQHGILYPACTQRCQPILGFMLCGLRA